MDIWSPLCVTYNSDDGYLCEKLHFKEQVVPIVGISTGDVELGQLIYYYIYIIKK
jgi:hypothetical protein